MSATAAPANATRELNNFEEIICTPFKVVYATLLVQKELRSQPTSRRLVSVGL
jgi:hypothetical protein